MHHMETMMSKTTVYICADGTLTYGPFGGKDKIVPQALPIAWVDNEETAIRLIVTVGRHSYDVPEADHRFEQQLNGRTIKHGYGPTTRYYYSGPEFVRNDVDSIFKVMKRVGKVVENINVKT